MSESDHSLRRPGLMPPEPVRWGLPDAAIGLILAEAVMVGTRLVLLPAFPANDAARVATQIGFDAILVAFVVAVARTRGRGRGGVRHNFGFELVWIDLPIGFALAAGAVIANEIVVGISVRLLGLPRDYGSNASLPTSEPWAVIDGLAVVSFIAPIAEELFFRGLMMRAIRNFVIHAAKRDGAATIVRAQRISIGVSALLFAAVHLYQATSPTRFVELGVSVLVFGLGAAWIASRTGRLGPSIIAHITNNFVITIGLLGLQSH